MATGDAVKRERNCWPCRKLTAGGEKNNKRRETWSGRFDFMVTSLGYVVGLENIYWFPYMFFWYGGGAFMTAYLIFVVFGALPLIVLEFAVGQYSRSNMMRIWNALPMMRGVAYGQIFAMVVYSSWYSAIITYSVYFCFASFTSNLPWVGCHHSWNTPFCSELWDDCLENGGIIVTNGSCVNLTMRSKVELGEYNMSEVSYASLYDDIQWELLPNKVDPSEEYWRYEVRKESSGIEEIGGVVWQLALFNLFAWIVTYFIVVRGIQISGKVAYFTTLFPYIMLTALLLRALTLDGGGYFVPSLVSFSVWPRIKDYKLWGAVALHVFHSFRAGVGSMTTLASFNRFHNNFIIDAVIIVIGNSLTNMFCGFTMFSILGVLAKQSWTPVYVQGFYMLFVGCPGALAKFPAAPLWSIMFFFMIFLMALGNQFVEIEVLVTVILDAFPRLRKRRVAVVAILCAFVYMTSFVYMTNAAPYWMWFVDIYVVGRAGIICGLLLPLIFSWRYGFERLKNDIRSMLGNKIVDHWAFNFWELTWRVVTPLILTLTQIYISVVTNDWKSHGYNGPPPAWCHVIGLLFIASTTFCIIGVWIYDFMGCKGSLRERLRIATKPMECWGPALPEDRAEAQRVHSQYGTTGPTLLQDDNDDNDVDNSPTSMELATNIALSSVVTETRSDAS